MQGSQSSSWRGDDRNTLGKLLRSTVGGDGPVAVRRRFLIRQKIAVLHECSIRVSGSRTAPARALAPAGCEGARMGTDSYKQALAESRATKQRLREATSLGKKMADEADDLINKVSERLL